MVTRLYKADYKAFLLAVAVVCTLVSSVGWAEAGSAGHGGQIACQPDKPTARPGDVLRVRVFALAPGGQTTEYIWTATAGSIHGVGAEATWSLKGVLSGIYTAKVRITSSGRTLGECSAEVVVIEAERGAPETPAARESARAFLVTGEKEKAGFGLYSYFLLGSPPVDATRPRYLKAIQAYLNLIQTVSDLQEYIAPGKLNITYLPVKVAAPASPSAEWLLSNYDYARARMLLDLFSTSARTGPYIVSTLAPLSGAVAIPSNHLFQDLSLVPVAPEDLMSWWISAFMNQAAQERFWEPQAGEMLALKLRTMISVEAIALPDVQKQLATWISWAK